MDPGRTKRRQESGHSAPRERRERREKQQAQICRQNRKEITAETQSLAISGEDGSTSLNPEDIQAVFSDDPARQLEATTKFCKLLTQDNPSVDRIIACGVVPRFVEFLAGPHAALQIKAAWALTNIACGTTEHTVVVISSGAVPHLINLLSSPILDAQDNAVRALGNIALDSPMCRDYVILAGALSPLLALLSGKQQIDTLRSASWTLSNFCHGVRHHPNWDLISPALPTLAKLIHSPDDEVLINTCLAISYLSYGSNHEIQAVIEAGVVPRLIELLNHRSSSVQIPALRSVENIVYGDDLQTQIVIAAGALPALSTLLTSPEDIIRKEACRVISNITGSSPPQIQAVIDAKLIPPLIDILANSPDLKIRTEACWAISNATFGALQEPSQVRYLVQQGCIKPLCESLTTMDSETNQLVLNAIDNIRKVGELDQLAAGDGAINLYATLVEYACSGLRFSIHDALAVTVHSGLFSLTIA